MSTVAVIGGGASGMMAAIAAARDGHEVSLYEKNEKLGKKLYLTGKGRCNLTNNCPPEALLQAVCVNAKFLSSAFHRFDAQFVMQFFEEQNLHLKTERGGRVFPVSDHASDVTAALTEQLRQSGVRVYLNREVSRLLTEPGEDGRRQICGLKLSSGKTVSADHVIVATGGLSYPSTGSTGDGYRFAAEAGHSVKECFPSLVPIETEGDWAQRMQGLSLKNVEVSVFDGKKELFCEFGEMLFTHFGVSGPLILAASSRIQKELHAHPLTLCVDLKPALSFEQLDARILREFDAARNKQFKNVLGGLYPSKLIPVIIERSKIPADQPVHDLSREERKALVRLTKCFSLTLTRLRDYNEAVITRGGVNVKEVNPATMESKLVRGLFFAGEVLDVDARTGGFNLQIAWSTGYAAGSGIGP